ncbi:hypothetical protein D3C73_755390 [compost metagenome]
MPLQERARGVGGVIGYAQQQMVFVAITIVAHAARQVLGPHRHGGLDQAVGQAVQPQALENAIDAALDRKRLRHARRAQLFNQQEHVLAVARADVEGVAVDVFARDGQARQLGQQLAAHRRQIVGLIAANVKDGAGFAFKRIQAHGEQADPAGRTRGLEQARRVRVEAGRRGFVDLAHVLRIARIRCGARVIADVVRAVLPGLQAGQDVFGRCAQFNPQVVHQA